MWPFKRTPVEVPEVPQDIEGLLAYHRETFDLLITQHERIGNPLSWRKFIRDDRIINARQNAVKVALDEREARERRTHHGQGPA
jgi:hypothetical protein